jgi:hypothetical protein
MTKANNKTIKKRNTLFVWTLHGLTSATIEEQNAQIDMLAWEFLHFHSDQAQLDFLPD